MCFISLTGFSKYNYPHLVVVKLLLYPWTVILLDLPEHRAFLCFEKTQICAVCGVPVATQGWSSLTWLERSLLISSLFFCWRQAWCLRCICSRLHCSSSRSLSSALLCSTCSSNSSSQSLSPICRYYTRYSGTFVWTPSDSKPFHTIYHLKGFDLPSITSPRSRLNQD